MSEKSPESHGPQEKLVIPETHVERVERTTETSETDPHDHSRDKLQESIHKARSEALHAEEISIGSRPEASQPVPGMHQALKNDAYAKYMHKIHGHLNPVERSFSKVIHSPIIEPVSEMSAKTIARPSGILGGGIAALVGSGVVLYMAKHYGFEYNFTTFLVLLVSGFAAGLLIEFCYWLLWRRSHK
jgi:hypothetical protein